MEHDAVIKRVDPRFSTPTTTSMTPTSRRCGAPSTSTRSRSSPRVAPLESSWQLDTTVEGREVSPGLSLRHAPGHARDIAACYSTPATSGSVRGRPAALTFQLNDPGFRSSGDVDPEEGSRTRTAWLDRVEAEGLTLATAHVPPCPIGRIVREEGQRRLRPR